MNKELTIILATKIDAYNQKVSDFRKFALSNEELEMFASAMEEYAAQEKRALEKENKELKEELERLKFELKKAGFPFY